MPDRTCAIDGCSRPYLARGWCRIHYYRWKHHGTTDLLGRGPTDPVPRLWDAVTFVPDGCWLRAGTRRDGYTRLRIDGREVLAHRFAYELLVGPIPAGLQIDHLCRNRSCIRPDHLDPVTQQENMRRGESLAAINARKARCPECDGAYRTAKNGWRFCHPCVLRRQRERNARMRGKQ